ncbi:hypothetical protein CDAR_431171 [Caerostris darwini]|uniref:Uncharacterized protein n=1 Tax=Caerostris darwini TaxID=1538125 RepID=A0AAV4RQV0_9ARAC|nr:hypothetical protein CDAR_431171 [Caerostris darwini]
MTLPFQCLFLFRVDSILSPASLRLMRKDSHIDAVKADPLRMLRVADYPCFQKMVETGEGLNPFQTQLDRSSIEEKRFLGFQPTHHPSWGITGMTVTVGKGTAQLTSKKTRTTIEILSPFPHLLLR